jgi:NAD+ synthase
MRNYATETEKWVAFIRGVVKDSGAKGIIFANSGGKDCILTGILCKKACDDTLSLILPCGSKRNYESDMTDALAFSKQFNIDTRIIDLAETRGALINAVGDAKRANANESTGANAVVSERVNANDDSTSENVGDLTDANDDDPTGASADTTSPAAKFAPLSDTAIANIAPRLRMCTLYAVGASENRLVAGTGNRSERYVGYFTKWGDGACDFNPIADLTVTEVYEFLRFLGAPAFIFDKAPSAGLYEGQTDEKEMGVSYRSIDGFLLNGYTDEKDMQIIARRHTINRHKLALPVLYNESE